MKNIYTNNAAIGPIAVPAVKAILDALAFGSAAYGLSQSGNQDYRTKFIQNHDYEIQEANRQALKEVLDKLDNRRMTVPIAENALVLRPEYRTSMPVDILNTIGYKPVWNSDGDSGDTSQQSGTQTSGTTSVSGGNPESDDKDKKIKELKEKLKQLEKNEKGFKKGLQKGWEHTKKVSSTIATGLGYGIGFGVPVVGTGLGAYGLYKRFSSDKKDNSSDDGWVE